MNTSFFSSENDTRRKILITLIIAVVLGASIYFLMHQFKRPIPAVKNPNDFTVEERLDMLKQLETSSYKDEPLSVEQQQSVMDKDKKSKAYVANQKLQGTVSEQDINRLFNSLK